MALGFEPIPANCAIHCTATFAQLCGKMMIDKSPISIYTDLKDLGFFRLVDFSDPASRPNSNLSEEESEMLSKTAMFEDFVVSFTDQCLTLIENTSREQVRGLNNTF